MTVRLSHLKYTFIVTITFWGCNNAPVQKTPINQIFVQDRYKIYNIFYENGDCDLQVYADGQVLFNEEISKTPCIVRSIANDTITVERIRLLNPPDDSPSWTEFKTIGNNLVLRLTDQFVTTGSMKWGPIVVDSSSVKNNFIICHYKNGIDSLPLNQLYFSGKKFYIRWFKEWNKGNLMNVKYYKIDNPELIRKYWLSESDQ